MKLKTRFWIDKENIKEIIKAIKENRLLCAINCNTTIKCLYCEWYYIKKNRFYLIAVTNSRTIGMDRVFSCYYYDLMGELSKYTTKRTIETLKRIQNYKTVGGF